MEVLGEEFLPQATLEFETGGTGRIWANSVISVLGCDAEKATVVSSEP